ncbi:hypothetical protein IH601_02490 [Candidatus Bipolaricaulota bacterium]|nr:hypothetical protein [Candidatus Bipolaricaulota bacterium]TFH07707.1 MAG: hypothetical protein E4H08_09050 [Candidatus Atribacteria bacterium]
MKRYAIWAFALSCCLLAAAGAFASGYEDPRWVIENEWTEEISRAAGLALVSEFLSDYTPDELLSLAENGTTPGKRLAAERALFSLGRGLTALIDLDDDVLFAFIAKGDTDAADAYVFKHRVQYRTPEAALDAIEGTSSSVLQISIGKLLGGFYGPGSPLGQKTEAELRELVVNGATVGERIAATTALTTYWIIYSDWADVSSEITRVCTEIWAISGVARCHELALAYQGYLTYLFSL